MARRLPAHLKGELRAILLGMADDPGARPRLERALVERFEPVTDASYDEIRRMLAKLGHKVMRLRRIAIGPLKLDRLPKGKSRKLSLKELQSLRHSIEGRKREQKA